MTPPRPPDPGPTPAARLVAVAAHSFLAAVPFPSLLVAMDDVVLAANTTGSELFRVPDNPAARGVSFKDLEVSYQVQALRPAVEAVKRGEASTMLSEVSWAPRGHERHQDFLVRRLTDGQGRQVAVLVMAVPVEDLVAARTTLETLRVENEDLLQRREADTEELVTVNEELRIANETLQQQVLKLGEAELADARKNQFLAILAHELRNPLGAITSALHVIGRPASTEPQVQRALRIAERQLQHEARLLDDLLDVSRIVLGKVTLRTTWVDLRRCVRGVVEGATFAVQGQAIDLRMNLPDEPLGVEGDPTRLEQCVANLLNNALKFSAVGGHVTVDARRDGEQAVVVVSDDGIGIAPDMLERVFDLFTQADSTLARTRGGLGVGLTLARALVRLHGGTVTARSPGIGQGSQFEIRLLFVPEPGGQVEPTPDAPAGPRRILLADDNADAREMLRTLLQMDGHTVMEAGDGATAIRLTVENTPDILLLDIGLPGIDGFEVAVRVKRLGSRVRLVALSGYGDAASREHAREVGFDAYLVKPVAPEDVARVLSGL